MERHFAELHLWHHRQPQGRGLPSPRRLPERALHVLPRRRAAARGVSVDGADVPLQRLVHGVGPCRGGRHQRVPAQGGSRAGLRADQGAPRHQLRWRAHRSYHLDQRQPGLARGHRLADRRHDCRRRSATRDHRGHGRDGRGHHARLWPHRNLRPGDDLRPAGRVVGARRRTPRRAPRPAGCSLPRRGGADRHGPGDDDAGAGRRRDDGRGDVPRQPHDEGLPEEPAGHGRGVRGRLVPLRRSRR